MPMQAANRIEGARMPKIPPFIQTDPDLWYLQVEARFRNSNITVDSTKVDYICPSLGGEALSAIGDIIKKDPAPADIYKEVKERFIPTSASSAEHNLRKLLKGEVMTDGKPTRILQRLRGLNPGSCDDKIIRSVFLDQLSPQHRSIVVATDIDDLHKLAEVIDKLAEASGNSDHQDSAVSSNNPSSFDAEAAFKRLEQKLERKFEALTMKIDGNTGSSKESSDSQTRGRSKRDRSSSRDSSGLCFAHRKYPDSPRSCREWCSKFSDWQKQNRKTNSTFC